MDTQDHAGRSKWRLLKVNGTMLDAYDGAARVLFDAQRFGFAIREFTLRAKESGGAIFSMTVAIPEESGVDVALSRLRRHPTIESLDAAGRSPGNC